MIKAAFFDVDGTLLSHKSKQVPLSTREALKKLKAAGIRCVVSTGRMLQEMDKLPMGNLGFDAHITLNGQLTLDGNREILYGMPITGALRDFVLQLFREKRIPVILVEKDRLYLNFINQRVEQVQADISSKVPPLGEYRGGELYQACFYPPREQAALLRTLTELGTVTHWHPDGWDVIAKGGGKQTAIRRYLEENGLTPEEAIAFGDGENDIGMLKLAGIGVAMGNAEAIVKEAADYVTTDIDDNGIANALKHFGLIT